MNRMTVVLLIVCLIVASCGKSPTSPTTEFTLSVAVSPSNGGTVAKSPDKTKYTSGAIVTLTATAASGFQFGQWQGDAIGTTNPTTVTMNGNKSVTAVFNSPDLVVSALTAIITATDYVVTATVTNQGTADAVGAWTLRLITPPGGVIGTMDIPYPNQTLAAGASWTYGMRWIMSLPTGFTYDFTAYADVTNTIAESDESNNTKTIHIVW